MTALVPLKSAEYILHDAAPREFIKGEIWGGKLRSSSAEFTATTVGFSASPVQMIRMPAGRVRIYPLVSFVDLPDGAATATAHVGYGAHVDEAGATVAADPNAFLNAEDIATGPIRKLLVLPATGFLDLNSQAGFDITITFNTADIVGTAAKIVIFYSMAN